jgi:apolipoprotein N-acyltransferase
MTLVLVVAGFFLVRQAIGRFTGLGPAGRLGTAAAGAPLLQPQVLVAALLRRAVRQRHGPALGALAGAAGWVGTEWLLLKPLGDTLGHGLYPSVLLRQAADLGGTAGLTLLLLLVNEALNAGWARRGRAAGALAAAAAAGVAATAAAGRLRPGGAGPAVPDPHAPLLRLGLVQANITDIESAPAPRAATRWCASCWTPTSR